jgi:hypothetical protein
VTLAQTATLPRGLRRVAPLRSRSDHAFEDLVAAIETDAGGRANLTESQRQLCRRAATISTQCRLMEQNQAEMDAGKYSTLSNSLRRILRDLGSGRAR